MALRDASVTLSGRWLSRWARCRQAGEQKRPVERSGMNVVRQSGAAQTRDRVGSLRYGNKIGPLVWPGSNRYQAASSFAVKGEPGIQRGRPIGRMREQCLIRISSLPCRSPAQIEQQPNQRCGFDEMGEQPVQLVTAPRRIRHDRRVEARNRERILAGREIARVAAVQAVRLEVPDEVVGAGAWFDEAPDALRAQMRHERYDRFDRRRIGVVGATRKI